MEFIRKNQWIWKIIIAVVALALIASSVIPFISL